MQLTSFYLHIVSSAALVVRQSLQQFAVAANWVGGTIETQVTSPTAVMMWLLVVQLSTAANLHTDAKSTNI